MDEGLTGNLSVSFSLSFPTRPNESNAQKKNRSRFLNLSFYLAFYFFPFPTLCYSQMTSNELLTDLLSLPSFPELACFALVGYYDSSGREVTTRLQTLIMRAMDGLLGGKVV